MAQKVQTLYIDDLDGSEAEGSVRFGIDGSEYEIDLNAGHSEALRTTLQRYISHARKVSSAPARASRGGRAASSVDTQKVREWAKAQGIDVKERGRIPANVVKEYRAAVGH